MFAVIALVFLWAAFVVVQEWLWRDEKSVLDDFHKRKNGRILKIVEPTAKRRLTWKPTSV